MTDQPITPTRIIPAGEPIPAPPMPYAPHDAVDLPPWRTPAPPPRAAAPPPPPPADPPIRTAAADPDPAPLAVRVTVDLVYPEAEPARRWNWAWLTSRLRPWSSLVAAVLVLAPWLGGHSITGGWSALLNECRDTYSISGAYVLAGTALGLALLGERIRPGLATRAALIVALVGGTGALGWYDPITALTGVRP